MMNNENFRVITGWLSDIRKNPRREVMARRIITVVGAGNGGHLVAALGGAAGYEVRLLSRRPEIFSGKQVVCQRPGLGSDIAGKIAAVSSEPEEVLPGSDLIMWCGPVNKTRTAYEIIAPHVGDAVVGTMFGQGCTHLLGRQVLGPSVPYFALQSIPWLCTTIEPGCVARAVGAKHYTRIATTRNVDFGWLADFLGPCVDAAPDQAFARPKLQKAPDFTPIVLNPGNQIIHPARLWGRFVDEDMSTPFKKGSLGSLYGDFDDRSAEALQGLDNELQAIRAALHEACPELDVSHAHPIGQRILAQYGDQVADPSSLRTIMATNSAYAMAQFPVLEVEGGVMLNIDHRVVQDDISHGLVPLKDIALQLRLVTPWIDEMIEWHQALMGKEFLKDGRLNGKDMGECTSPSVLGGTELKHIGQVPEPEVQWAARASARYPIRRSSM